MLEFQLVGDADRVLAQMDVPVPIRGCHCHLTGLPLFACVW